MKANSVFIKIPLLVAALFVFIGFAGAEDIVYMDPFVVYSPSVMAQGGSASASASGYDALFANPAAFIGTKERFSLSFTSWGFADFNNLLIAAGAISKEEAADYGYNYDSPYVLDSTPETVDPSDANYASSGDTDYDDKQEAISTQLYMDMLRAQTKAGLGVGFAGGIAYVGGGLGLGAVATTNLFLRGDTFPFGIAGTASTTLAFIGGLSFPINLGPLHFALGADLRPMMRFYSKLDGSVGNSLISLMSQSETSTEDDKMAGILKGLNGVPVYQGTAIGIDLGASLSLGGLTVGLSVRDLFDTKFSAMEHRLGDFINELTTSGDIPSNEGGYDNLDTDGLDSDAIVNEAEITLALPMTMSLGVAYRPNLGNLSFIIDPKVHIDLIDPIGVIRDKQSPWALLHLGAEAKLFRFLKLRAGINQGYFTAGVGAKLAIFDINAAYFTRELGPYAGDQPNSGISVEVAIRSF